MDPARSLEGLGAIWFQPELRRMPGTGAVRAIQQDVRRFFSVYSVVLLGYTSALCPGPRGPADGGPVGREVVNGRWRECPAARHRSQKVRI